MIYCQLPPLEPTGIIKVKNDWRTVKAEIASWGEGASRNVPTRYTECYQMVMKYLAPATHDEARCYAAQAYLGIRCCNTYLATTLPSYKGDHYPPKDVGQAWRDWAASKKQATLEKWLPRV